MIADAAASTSSLALNNVGFSWFDVVFVGVAALGLFMGRRNGMAKELVPFIQWIVIILVCGFAYRIVGDMLVQSAGLNALPAYVISYIGLALVIFLIFSVIKKKTNKKLTGSTMFGNAEYYLGVPAGIVRYLCMLIFAMSLLNARYYTPNEIAQMHKFQNDVYGSNFFPTLETLQEGVYKDSFLGPHLKDWLNPILIAPTAPGAKGPATPGKNPPGK